MIPNDVLINALNELDYHFKRQADRVMIYRKRGSTSRLTVRRITLHDETAVKILLRDAGMPPDEIEKFISTYHCDQH